MSRIKQFIKAVCAEIDVNDNIFVDKYLNANEKKLFYAMSIADQRHTLDTAYTVIKLIPKNAQLDESLIVKAALLHDIGKQKGDISVVEKAIAVIFNKLIPEHARKIAASTRAKTNADRIAWVLYIYYYHPEIGAGFLRTINAEEKLIKLVLHHHSREQGTEELELLKKADSLN